ncbi:MAG: PhoU domain-containing protein [Desulfohalobium sp.]
MISLESLEENFRFLTLEVANQVRATRDILEQPEKELVERLIARDDYIDNLKTIIENKCFSRIHSEKGAEQSESNRIRAIHIICVNLERIADHCVNIVSQLKHFNNPTFLHRYDFHTMFHPIQEGLDMILPVQRSQKVAQALTICKIEYELDNLYKERFDRIQEELRSYQQIDVGDLITALFIFRYLERIGDALLNVGEAFIFAFLGEKIKIHQFQALQETLSQAGYEGSLSEIDFESIWGGRSGCRIRRVKNTSPDPSKEVIFKEGHKDKIQQERDNISRWSELFPGTAPQVVGYNEGDNYASMLVEFLPGCTLDEVILTTDPEQIHNALFVFEQTLVDVWEATLDRQTRPQTRFIRQLRGRLSAIEQVHPGLIAPDKRIGNQDIPSLHDLLTKAWSLEQSVLAPFSVLLHGDCNLNNIVYDFEEQRIRFIDLYRSQQDDYVQDVAVFLVSNFRMPIFEPALRQRLNWTIRHFFHFARGFAAKQGDTAFEFRLALGLSRSFLTSTRFELDNDFAYEMGERGIYLLERLIEHGPERQQEFALPESILYS